MVTVARGASRRSWSPTVPSAWSSPHDPGAGRRARARRGAGPDRARVGATAELRQTGTAGGSTPTGPAADLSARSGRGLGTGAGFDAPYWMEAPLWQAVCPTLICGPDRRRAARGRRVGRPRPGARACRRRWSTVLRRLAAPVPTDPARAARRRAAPRRLAALPGGPPTPFTIPGHKQRHDLVGDVVAGDVPLYAGLDTMKLTRGVLGDAEARAARLWGADVCRFSTGGATHANQAVALALGGDGDRVVVSRTLHRSMLLGLVLAGLTPVWVRPEVDAATGLPLGVAPETVAGRSTRTRTPGPCSSATRPTSAPSATSPGWPRRPRARRAARGRRGLGRALRLPPGPAPPRAPARRRRDGRSAPTRRCRPGARRRSSWPGPGGSTPPGSTRASRRPRPPAPPARSWRAPTLPARCSSATASELLGAPSPRPRGPGPARRGRRPRRARRPGVDPLKLTIVLPAPAPTATRSSRTCSPPGCPSRRPTATWSWPGVARRHPRRWVPSPTSSSRPSSGTAGGPRPVVGPAAYGVEPVAAFPPRQAFFAAPRTSRSPRGRPDSAELVAPYPPGIPVLAPGEEITAGSLAALEQARAPASASRTPLIRRWRRCASFAQEGSVSW